jgi:hypothetical protein
MLGLSGAARAVSRPGVAIHGQAGEDHGAAGHLGGGDQDFAVVRPAMTNGTA